jgi:beta-galactosidase
MGKNLYIAGWADQGTLKVIFSGVCSDQGIQTTELIDCVRVRDTLNHRFWFNFSEEEVAVGSIKIPASGVFWEQL